MSSDCAWSYRNGLIPSGDGYAVARCCRIRVAIGLACFLLAGTRDPAACFCGLTPPCAAFWRADAVFVGRVTANEVRQADGQPSETVTTLTVFRMFRGEPLPSIALRGMMTSC
jgi:hypothetical protein